MVSVVESDEEMVPGEDHKRRRMKCRARNAQAMPGRLWKSWNGWPAGRRCAMEGASSLPRRRHPARYFSETATGVPHLFLCCPPAQHFLGERWTAVLEPLDSRVEEEKDQGTITDRAATAGKPKAISPRKPTFIQMESWKAIQKARRKGMSLCLTSTTFAGRTNCR